MNSRLKSLDSLRGFACLLVLAAHIISTNHELGMYANGCGKIGVWCFMVLSGFLTFLPYTLEKDIPKENLISFIIKYYKKKLVKLYPTYFIILLLAFALGFLLNFTDIIKHLLVTAGTAHFWYMPVIIKFYLLTPFLILLLGYIKEKAFFLLITLTALIFSIIFPFTNYIENSIKLYWYLPVFLIGCSLAFLYNKIKIYNGKWLGILTGIATLIIIFLTPKMREFLFGIKPSRWLQNKYLIFTLLWSIIILGILVNKTLCHFLNECKWLQFIGKISYEVYLIHYIVMWKVIQYTNNTILVAIIVSGISIVLAILINRVISSQNFI